VQYASAAYRDLLADHGVIASYIEAFYNRTRRHFALGYQSPLA